MKKCCENYNGILDITNSCIFCKTYKKKTKVKKNKVIIWLDSKGTIAVRYKIPNDKLISLVNFIKKLSITQPSQL